MPGPPSRRANLDDIISAVGDQDPTDHAPYFLGSIVLIKDLERPEADVVDGQQRLTTLTVRLTWWGMHASSSP
ncbi:MAG: DUF262 domain-containing protein, partial [Methylibium sp.]